MIKLVNLVFFCFIRVISHVILRHLTPWFKSRILRRQVKKYILKLIKLVIFILKTCMTAAKCVFLPILFSPVEK